MKHLLLKLFAILAISTAAFANEEFLKSTLKGTEAPATKFVSFSYPDIRTIGGIKIVTGPGVVFNHAYPWCWLMHINDTSYISVIVNFSKEELENNWYLNIKQLSSIAGSNYSPIAIDVNGVNIVDHHNPKRDAWRIDHFAISQDLLQEGKNTITLRLQDAMTNYWIENLTFSPNEPANVQLLDYLGVKK